MRRICLALAVVLPLMAGSALADVTGSVSGVVKDSQGGVLPGATVRISGDMLPGGRDATTTENGVYLFEQLLPGVYVVEATLSGLGTAKRQVRVQVDRDTQVELVLSPTLSEEVTVTAEAPAVDLKSTEVNFNFSEETIKTLPLERSYRGLFALIPGVAENRNPVGPSGGGSRQDNTYLIDGVNITNPGFGYLSTEVNQLDITEFNIKRGGISAEFGRSAGFVTNAVSKSGTNQIGGSARFEWMPDTLIGDFDNPAFRDPLINTVVNPAIGIGGPFIKDRLFWYGSARYYRETKWDRVNRLNQTLPDQVRKGHELYGKVTATPTQQHLLAASLRDRPNEVENAGIDAGFAGSVATNDDNSSRLGTASWSFFVTDRTTLEVRYLHLTERNEAVPVTDLGRFPRFDVGNLAGMGQYPDPLLGNLTTGGHQYTNFTNYKRDEVRAILGHYLDIGRTGHQIKVGGGYEFGEEELQRTVNGWGLLARLTVSGQPRIRARYYPDQPAQFGWGRTYSLFAQDTISFGQRLTVNAGVLVNRDEFGQDLGGSNGCPSTVIRGGTAIYESEGDTCTFIRFDFGDQIQPRIGVNYNVRAGAGDKVYANYGRYYNTDQKSSGRSLAPRRIFQNQALFDLAGNLVSDGPLASTTGKQIDAELEPTYNDEWLAGYATPIGGDWSADLFFIYRDTKRFIEDVPTTLPDTGPYRAANLPCTSLPSCRNANAERTYKAFTVELNRRLANRWSANASYTWSRLEGNFDLDYSSVSSVFNTSSFIQDGPGTNVEEPNRFGPLLQDRPHLFKLFLNYVPREGLTLGSYLRVQSGAPWNARGRDWEGGPSLNYLEPAGSRRNPTWTNLDLLAAYRLGLGGRAGLTLEGRVLNVFDAQTRLETEAQQFLDLNTIPNPPYFAPYTQPNPLFGTGKYFAPPRRFLVAALVDF
jgi:hypothetical protein